MSTTATAMKSVRPLSPPSAHVIAVMPGGAATSSIVRPVVSMRANRGPADTHRSSPSRVEPVDHGVELGDHAPVGERTVRVRCVREHPPAVGLREERSSPDSSTTIPFGHPSPSATIAPEIGDRAAQVDARELPRRAVSFQSWCSSPVSYCLPRQPTKARPRPVDDHVIGPQHPDPGEVDGGLRRSRRDADQRFSSRLTTYAAPSGAKPIPEGVRTSATTVVPRRRCVPQHLMTEHVREPERAVVPPEPLGVRESGHHDLGLVSHGSIPRCRGRTDQDGGRCSCRARP